ncbi:MAG: alpha-amylase family glycosyl hydrolase, partial [Candidatus Angelobacter sp.]
VVDREKARFSAWYEMFPRSCADVPGRHGTFRDCENRLPYVAEMGFDILYFPPIHPVGRINRKGKNNSEQAAPDDVGSPWAIGAAEGGHDAVLPQLGTLEDFKSLQAKAKAFGLEVALDLAFQCTPDHPYVKSHKEWFHVLPDGSVQYAENPPKRYQDIYPFYFESEQADELCVELRRVVLYWIAQGIRIFRVDNPHTKPFEFWEWLINDIKSSYPDVLFLAEAFTRPKVMYRLAKLGFTQSYTYFAWRTTKSELTDYLTELTQTEVREFFRPNLWPNTPDILTEFLQFGGRPAFMIRIALAATMGASYGIYGPAFELCENHPVKRGSEEYLDSEKYQLRHWDINDPRSLKSMIARVNQIRKANAALQSDWSLRFHSCDNDQLIVYSKTSED